MRKALAVLATAALAACGGGGDSTPTGTTGGQTPTLSLSISPATLSVQQSGSNTVAITVTRGGGLTANVDLSVEGAPTGVTGAFSAASLANGVNTSTLTLSASSTAAAGASTLTIRAKSTGVSDQTASVALTVTAATAAGGFTIATAPATIVQGASATSTVTIARTGAFTGAVALTVTGAPTGLTATLNPTSVAAGSTTASLSLNAAASTAVGSYTLTVSGTGTGVSNASATVGVTVQAASTSSGNIAWTYCSNALPIWFAVQDGSGNWTRVLPDVNNAFKFNINSASGGVTVVTQGTNSFTTNIAYGTAAELTSQAATCVGGVQKTLTGSVAGLGSSDLAAVAMGGAIATVTSPTTGFTLTNVAGGPQDLLAVQSSQTISGTSIVFAAKKGIIRRNLNLANNAVIPTLDFSAAEAFTPASANLTMANGGSDLLATALGYFTANGSSGSFTTGLPSSTATQTYYGVPTANQATGDFHALIGTATTLSGTTVSQIRTATKFFKTVADQTLTLGAAPNTPTVTTVATTPVARLRVQLNVQTDYNKLFTIGYSQTVGGISRQVTITATAASLPNASAVDGTIPDFVGVSGYDTNWGLKSGTVVTWVASASGWTFAGGAFGTSPVEGGVVLTGTKIGSITP